MKDRDLELHNLEVMNDKLTLELKNLKGSLAKLVVRYETEIHLLEQRIAYEEEQNFRLQNTNMELYAQLGKEKKRG